MFDNTILTRDDLCAFLKISDTTRQRLEKSDPSFPVKINVSARRVGYLRSDAHAWLNKQRDAATARSVA